MEETKGFYDLCIPFNKDERVLREICTELVDLGYGTIAIEQVFDHSKKENVKRSSDIFPEPVNIEWLKDEYKNKLKILQRLTIIYVDAAVAHAMGNSLNLKKYNLVAGQPKTDAALTHCCTTFNGDIVTFDAQAGGRIFVNRKAYQVAVKKGVFFEIKYSPLITDSNFRKDMIKIAHNYFVKGKSKSIIISSGATNRFELRGPYDVANLSFIFGLSEDQGKCAIDRFCRQLFLRAESRRLGKTIMFVKSSGPIVFSDSSSESEEDDIADKNDVNVITFMKCSSESDEKNEEEQPIKKKKLS
ncbi:ribonuclease P protein subunit p30 [Stomoxys calcitrans]|uniref:ribonuclease P protein subunit p30 n=1 Tax=Stomoxys calcitrans TaxID=35570 RepID=UPI0027E2ACD6|nr:ribonuclease P protein subunit p30 [Stomoxys calcitrans]